MLLQENTIFDKRYQLIRLLGRGGFSEVWLAKDSYTKLDIALKVYAPGQGMDSDGLAEFSAELAGVFNLNHTNLLKPTHVDAWEGMPYLIMPFCSRGSIVKQVGKMQEDEIWKLIHDVASGLAYLHKNDIVHQDIKPDNILLDDNGNYVITDFGISTKARSTLRKSAIGGAVSGGTMAYMGPERFSKQPAPTKASDIWSFGAMLYELITGNVPFGEMGGGMQKGGAEIPEINEPISDKLRQAIESMLALETWNRPTAEQLADGNINIPNTKKSSPSATVSQPETSSRATQRFVPTSSVETVIKTPKYEVDKSESNKSKPWRWLPILEMVILLPVLLRILHTSPHYLFDGYDLSLLWIVTIVLRIVAILSIYSLFIKLLIRKGASVKKAINYVLPFSAIILIVVEIVISLGFGYSNSFAITSSICCALCIGIWYFFCKKIDNTEREGQKALFYIVLCCFYLLILGYATYCVISTREKIKTQVRLQEIGAQIAETDEKTYALYKLVINTISENTEISKDHLSVISKLQYYSDSLFYTIQWDKEQIVIYSDGVEYVQDLKERGLDPSDHFESPNNKKAVKEVMLLEGNDVKLRKLVADFIEYVQSVVPDGNSFELRSNIVLLQANVQSVSSQKTVGETMLILKEMQCNARVIENETLHYIYNHVK